MALKGVNLPFIHIHSGRDKVPFTKMDVRGHYLPFTRIPSVQYNMIIGKRVKAVLGKILKTVKSFTPVRTGRLKKSFRAEIFGKFPNITGRVVSDVPYAYQVEHGKAVNTSGSKVEPGIPRNLQNRSGGHKMVERAWEAHKKDTKAMEHHILMDMLNLIDGGEKYGD
ncbi:MAG: HK97 gp10 family phage protein [bacterium]|nr:HK97 gp10 family phage protein [bacterium]